MGASASAEEVSGIRVFSVTPGSPAAEAGLETFFDFIVEVNGTPLSDPANRQAFAKRIQESEGGMAKMKVFNTRMQDTREIMVYPRKWSGTGLLGATVRHDAVDPGENHGIRVLDVFPNSPAAKAGLVPFQDFMLGTLERAFHDCDDLAEVLLTNLGKQIQVHVYSITTEMVREVTLEPNNRWGGEGCIGCGTGTGLLHRIPGPRFPPGGNRAAAAQVPGIAAPSPAATPSVPAGAPAIPTVTGVPTTGTITGIPSVPGSIPPVPGSIPSVPGIPAVPAAPDGVPAGLPAIKPSGAWNPAMMHGGIAVPTPGAAPSLAVPGPAPASAPLATPAAIPAATPAATPAAPEMATVPAASVPAYTAAPVQAPAPDPAFLETAAPVSAAAAAPVSSPALAFEDPAPAPAAVPAPASPQQQAPAPPVGKPVAGVTWPPPRKTDSSDDGDGAVL